MKEDTAKLLSGHNEDKVESPRSVFYISSNYIEKEIFEVNGNDKDLLRYEQEDEGFLTWMFYDEWKCSKLETPKIPLYYESAEGLFNQSVIDIPKPVKERLERGIKNLPDVKEYLKEKKNNV